MEFQIGSLADLISGSQTPHRARAVQKPLTPKKKEQADFNITPQNKSKTNLKKPKLVFTPEHRKRHLNKPKKTSVRQRKILGDDIDKSNNHLENRSSVMNDDDEAYESSDSKEEGKNKESNKVNRSKLNSSIEAKKRSKPSENVVKQKKPRKSGGTPRENKPMHGDSSNSEHDSDNELSEIEDEKQLSKDFEADFPPSDDEEHCGEVDDRTDFQKAAEFRQQQKLNRLQKYGEDEANRTLFVGNVPISKKCKKDMKNIFSQYGVIETVRIRGVPVKDLKQNPKVALIKNEIHSDRSTVLVYVKFKDPTSVQKALIENNRLVGENHIRVSRSNTDHAIHDNRKTIFVGNLPHATEDEDMWKVFSKCGDIASVRVIREKKTQIGKGFGYVNFEKTDGVELALNLSEEELTLNKRVLRVRRYTQSINKQKLQGNFQRRVPEGRLKYPPQQQRKQQTKFKFSQNSENVRNKREGVPISRSKMGNNKRYEKRAKMAHNSSHKKEEKADKPTNFLGFTAEKKKKKKIQKGDIKKKHLSRILTGKSVKGKLHSEEGA